MMLREAQKVKPQTCEAFAKRRVGLNLPASGGSLARSGCDCPEMFLCLRI